MKHILALAGSWTGTVASFLLQHASLAISIASAVASIILSIWGMRVAAANLRKLKMESAHEQAILCEACRRGRGPKLCPVEPALRPGTCPLAVPDVPTPEK